MKKDLHRIQTQNTNIPTCVYTPVLYLHVEDTLRGLASVGTTNTIGTTNAHNDYLKYEGWLIIVHPHVDLSNH